MKKLLVPEELRWRKIRNLFYVVGFSLMVFSGITLKEIPNIAYKIAAPMRMEQSSIRKDLEIRIYDEEIIKDEIKNPPITLKV